MLSPYPQQDATNWPYAIGPARMIDDLALTGILDKMAGPLTPPYRMENGDIVQGFIRGFRIEIRAYYKWDWETFNSPTSMEDVLSGQFGNPDGWVQYTPDPPGWFEPGDNSDGWASIQGTTEEHQMIYGSYPHHFQATPTHYTKNEFGQGIYTAQYSFAVYFIDDEFRHYLGQEQPGDADDINSILPALTALSLFACFGLGTVFVSSVIGDLRRVRR